MMSDGGLSSIGGFIEAPSAANPNLIPSKKKRNLPGKPDPNSEVVALSPKSLMATNRFICEVCNKGFQREQNLQLHRRGHNLPWKLKQRTNKEAVKRKVYVCPEKTCVHNDPSRALGDLTGIKKHYSRKHGEKRWKCEKCSKKYAVQSDWKAHSKICGTREYKCDCGTIFSRKDSFITHRAFCDALVQQNARFSATVPSGNLNLRNELMNGGLNVLPNSGRSHFPVMFKPEGLESRNDQLDLDHLMQKQPKFPLWASNQIGNPSSSNSNYLASSSTNLPELEQIASQNQWFKRVLKEEEEQENRVNLMETNSSAAQMFACAIFQKAGQLGSTRSNSSEIFGASGNNFGQMNSFSNMGSFNFLNQSRNELLFHQNLRKADDLNGLMGYTNGDHNGLLFGDIDSTPLMSSSRNFDPFSLMPNGNCPAGVEIKSGNGLTRDFLGVGASENRHLLQEFAPIDSTMNNLNHYSRINH
ncbi:zinc finger protein BALDIBIS-like [Primulina tabacum]|uniref:zinc finger protein BALDIBIS-like n=1 Tax=Primulina tabacum TaxID=48773 RepID=UPI003F5A267A